MPGGKSMPEQHTFLFEVSWEVCNKVGGIYTVIKSKIKEAVRNFGEHYCLIGPLLDNNPEFEESEDTQAASVRTELLRTGFHLKVGRWKTPEKPLVILVGYKNTLDSNRLLYQLWEDHSVDSMSGGWDYIEPVMFSTMAAKVIEVMSNTMPNLAIVSQFHEWMCGAGLLYIKKKVPRVSTIFTTHATVLGRSMCGSGTDIYKILSDINPDQEAARHHVQAKHSIEKATAREADCFTTVSEITAIEAQYLLKNHPDLTLPNGFNVHQAPAFDSTPNFFNKNRERLLSFASHFLRRDLPSADTVIISTSGRYEFRNKGIDMFLEALSQVTHNPENWGNKHLLVYLFILTGAVDLSKRKNDAEEAAPLTIYSQISTHPLWDPNNDPIVNTCKRLNLQNNHDDNVNIVFVPVYLNGNDGVFNMEYYEALSGCDLTVYPSYYEPWGYTPLESIAYSIPTVSTDLAGFGRWIITQNLESEGIKILKRFDRAFQDTVTELKDHIISFINLSRERIKALRQDVRQTAFKAEWSIFFEQYMAAVNLAKRECRNRLQGHVKQRVIEFKDVEYRGADSQRPRFRKFSVKTSIPPELDRLRDIASNVWWSWNTDAHELFSLLGSVQYDKLGHNPIALLETINPKKLLDAASNENYIQLYKNVVAKFEKYTSQQKCLVAGAEDKFKHHPVAYFSMEYGFHESLPIYSGGLGILSGDHIKSASDLNINMVGVGLLYKNGYFKQGISRDGEQLVEYYYNDFFRMPLLECHRNNEKMVVSIEFPGRKVNARIWEAHVGRVIVYFFDTDIPENSPADRTITSKLYGGGKQVRIEQEILLGIGGIRLFGQLGITPSVYHLNEGHSAFLIIERLINLTRDHGLDIETAREVIKSSTVFTTHTPVPAGNETFDMPLVENYLRNYSESQGLPWQEVADLGHKNITDTGPYEMTALALKNTCKRNGVSRLHGEVSRKMWTDIWSGFLTEEVPITHITNGVHAATWITTEIKALINKFCSLNFNADLLNKTEWKKLDQIPDDTLWLNHVNLKNKLFDLIKERVSANWTREGEDPALLDRFLANLTPAPLTIGFARRFASYKRATLILRDLERLKKLLSNSKGKVQLIFAGKAHPNDKAGFDLIRQIVQLSKKEEFLGKIIFVENYDMMLARRMISGVDVWLNTPRRPLEASGTSGQKAGMNGILNMSVLDGWWDECCEEGNGWAIGDRKEYKNPETQDIVDCDSFYDHMENETIPLYYTRNSKGIPDKWVRMMKNSMTRVISEFNTHRMLSDYTVKMYIPAADKYVSFAGDNFQKAREIAMWKKSIRARFPSIHINSFSISGIEGDILNVGDELSFALEVHKGKIDRDEIRAEIVIFQDLEEDALHFLGDDVALREDIALVPMTVAEEAADILKYSGMYKAAKSGKFNYGIRILPCHPEVDDHKDLNLVFWG
ncbi:MAG: alpha-glucan family phosphorylase [Spirochaetaceae bacterium]|nr:MAG: alpha-glucan family phosphorylase [Spirochaetaceae bacterium]